MTHAWQVNVSSSIKYGFSFSGIISIEPMDVLIVICYLSEMEDKSLERWSDTPSSFLVMERTVLWALWRPHAGAGSVVTGPMLTSVTAGCLHHRNGRGYATWGLLWETLLNLVVLLPTAPIHTSWQGVSRKVFKKIFNTVVAEYDSL